LLRVYSRSPDQKEDAVKPDHDPNSQRFALALPDGKAELHYENLGGMMTITHTFVSPALRGQGLAGHLMQAALNWAREKNLKVAPQCSYAARFLDEHPEFESLRAEPS
jgi:uncharacterized protein